MGMQFQGIDERRATRVVTSQGCYDRPHIVGRGAEPQAFGAWGMNLNQANAIALLGLLGVGADDHGQITMAEARRGWIWATNTFERRGPKFVRAMTTCDEIGRAKEIVVGADLPKLRRLLEEWIALVGRLERAGATHVVWS